MADILMHSTVQVNHTQADEVFMTGDFNRWSVPGQRMSRIPGDGWVAKRPVTGQFACVALRQGRVIAFITAALEQAASIDRPGSDARG